MFSQCEISQQSSVAEFISAMAAGWKSRLIVETWSQGGAIAASVGLAVARHHAGGRHVCVVPDEESRSEYTEAIERVAGMSPEVVVGEPEKAVEGLPEIDFLVVDCRRGDFVRIFRAAKLGQKGAVLICKNASSRSAASSRWRAVVGGGSRRVVRSVFLPVGKGLEIVHVAAAGVGVGGPEKSRRRWVRHVDRRSREEFVIRR